MAASKSLMSFLADLELREVVCVFKGAGAVVVGTIIAGNREVCMVRRRGGSVTNVLLPAVMEVFELDGSGFERLYPWFEGMAD